jgi:tRNA (cmo5U34)-methyltransferase
LTQTTDFSFGRHASKFRNHISLSIPGYASSLVPACIGLSRRFVQRGSSVLDIGCSTGHTLASIRKANQAARPDVNYAGIDIEPSFREHWDRLTARNLCFGVADARDYAGYDNLSVVLCTFTLQFIAPKDKMSVLRHIHSGLVEGGALIIAEKTLAETSRVQDVMTFPYYDQKLKNGFSEKDILDKERQLRGQMTLWTEKELQSALALVGFSEIHSFWQSHMFVGYLALKSELRVHREVASNCTAAFVSTDLPETFSLAPQKARQR